MQKKAMTWTTCLEFLSPKVDFKTELRWEKSDYDGSKILQAKDATPGRILSLSCLKGLKEIPVKFL